MSANSSSATSIMSASTKTTKRVTKKTDEAPVAAAAPAPVAEAKPVKATKTKATKTEATPAVAAPAPVAAAAPAVAAPVTEEVRLEAEVKSVTARLLSMREALSELITESKKLEKKATKLQKVADKRRRRKAVAEGEEGKPARPSIFQIPVNISPELCAFMGRPSGSQESRSNVTKFVTNYVKEKGLKNKHTINADATLRKLLNLKESDQLTYFNLQKHLNVHYPKSAAKLAAAASTA